MVWSVGELVLPEGITPVKLVEFMHRAFHSMDEMARAAQGTTPSNNGDAAVVVWESSRVGVSHTQLALECGRNILLDAKKRRSDSAGISFDIQVLVSTGTMTIGPVAGQMQAVGNPWVIIKKLETFVTRDRSQLLYASEDGSTIEGGTPVGEIPDATGKNIPVFEFAV
jgi:hypothetical protein